MNYIICTKKELKEIISCLFYHRPFLMAIDLLKGARSNDQTFSKSNRVHINPVPIVKKNEYANF